MRKSALLTTREKSQSIREFETKCMQISHNKCNGCLCVSLNIEVNSAGFCSACSRKDDKMCCHTNELHPIWHLDGIPQCHAPVVLSRLADAEKMLIQRARQSLHFITSKRAPLACLDTFVLLSRTLHTWQPPCRGWATSLV